ncbi:hypothetical protein B0H19DRAFT_1271696 [Mycena capillaripes]|nr:hypothetical protein B0H19DRAFT_1271696 [Mycena capillaripes]
MAQSAPVDFLKNRNEAAKLGPFDGRVAAVVAYHGVDYLITTLADYIPELPSTFQHDVFLRKDMRYGADDYTQWPQQSTPKYCHLAAVRTQAAAPPAIQIMWWNPRPEDFCTAEVGRTVTKALGRLDEAHLHSFSSAVNEIWLDYKAFTVETPAASTLDPLSKLVVSLRAAMERLEAIPATFEVTMLAVRNLQRTFLECDAMLEYMRMYKPHMENPKAIVSTRPAPLIGTYTTNAGVVQELYRADIPYWYIREARSFQNQNILELVHPHPPASLEQAPHPNFPTLCRTTNNTDTKIEAIQKCSLSVRWYEDPFEVQGDSDTGANERASSSKGDDSAPHKNAHASRSTNDGGPSRSHASNRDARYLPYAKPSAQPKGSSGRDKFKSLKREEMPPTIPYWERALASVDTSHPPLNTQAKDTYYILPEPALLAAPEAAGKRQQLLLSSQEWREILDGKVTSQGRSPSKTTQRVSKIDTLLSPALQACGLSGYRDFPADVNHIPPITIHRAREIIWQIAEINFRFEFLALDRRASGRNRSEECRQCFPGGRLIGIPIAMSKQGFAALASVDRHPYTLRLATLMCDWDGTPDLIREAPTKAEWSSNEMRWLEMEVAAFYTQTFYNLFGRAAVIPMRLEHEFGT